MAVHRKKTGRKPRRFFRRKPRIFRMVKWRPTKVYKTKQIIDLGDVVQNATVDTGGAYAFLLSNLDGYTNLTALFDQYRIDKIKVIFKPRVNVENVQTSATYLSGILYTVIDYDDNNTISKIGAREYQNCRECQNYKGQVRTFTPHVAIATYQGAFTAFANKAKQWIDSAYPSAQHYGLKWVISAGAGVGQTVLDSWKVECIFYMSFKNKYG